MSGLGTRYQVPIEQRRRDESAVEPFASQGIEIVRATNTTSSEKTNGSSYGSQSSHEVQIEPTSGTDAREVQHDGCIDAALECPSHDRLWLLRRKFRRLCKRATVAEIQAEHHATGARVIDDPLEVAERGERFQPHDDTLHAAAQGAPGVSHVSDSTIQPERHLDRRDCPHDRVLRSALLDRVEISHVEPCDSESFDILARESTRIASHNLLACHAIDRFVLIAPSATGADSQSPTKVDYSKDFQLTFAVCPLTFAFTCRL